MTIYSWMQGKHHFFGVIALKIDENEDFSHKYYAPGDPLPPRVFLKIYFDARVRPGNLGRGSVLNTLNVGPESTSTFHYAEDLSPNIETDKGIEDLILKEKIPPVSYLVEIASRQKLYPPECAQYFPPVAGMTRLETCRVHESFPVSICEYDLVESFAHATGSLGEMVGEIFGHGFLTFSQRAACVPDWEARIGTEPPAKKQRWSLEVTNPFPDRFYNIALCKAIQEYLLVVCVSHFAFVLSDGRALIEERPAGMDTFIEILRARGIGSDAGYTHLRGLAAAIHQIKNNIPDHVSPHEENLSGFGPLPGPVMAAQSFTVRCPGCLALSFDATDDLTMSRIRAFNNRAIASIRAACSLNA